MALDRKWVADSLGGQTHRAPRCARLRLIAHLFGGLVLIATSFRRASPERRDQMIRAWSIKLLQLCGITLQVHTHGQVLDAGAMVVSNHVSWLDIYVIDAWRPTPFVAKAEIARWPIVGALAKAIGTVFIHRERRGDAKRIVERLSTVLKDEGLICLFPEGTTGDGRVILPFHANILQAAVTADAPVQPICLMYEDAEGRQSLAPAYVGDLGLGETLGLVLERGPMIAHLYIGEPLTGLTDRRSASASAQAAIAAALLDLQSMVKPPSEADIVRVQQRMDSKQAEGALPPPTTS